MSVLVTGAAGFIGSYLCHALLKREEKVIGIDNLNDYYDVSLKQNRLKQFCEHANFQFIQLDLANRQGILRLFHNNRFDNVIHLAAQDGAAYSLEDPYAFVDSNINGFIHILEACRDFPVKHLVYASSGSVYGNNIKIPFSESDPVDKPTSLYSATKKSNELMAYSYSHLYQIPATGLRIFSVYGPWGRPDMDYFKFAHAIMKHQPIHFDHGKHNDQNLTYIDDIVNGMINVIDKPPKGSLHGVYHTLYNMGSNISTSSTDFIRVLEQVLDTKAIINKPIRRVDSLKHTYVDIHLLRDNFDYAPQISLNSGLEKFANWFRQYYNFNHPYYYDVQNLQQIGQF